MTKKLLFFLAIYLLAYNNLLNAQCSTGNNDLTGTQAGGSGRWSQSFQASCTGDLNNLKVYGSRDVSEITVTIYEGDGFSGTVLGSVGGQSITTTTAYTDAEYSTFDLSSANINLIGGNTYTYDLSTGDYHYDETPSPNYNGGTLYYATLQYTDYDMLFEVNMTLTKAYVNINATGNNNGTSWTDAFTNLQDAIDTTETDGEIWVAAGTYVPTASPDDVSTDTRDYAFHVDKNLKIYGGFAGTETTITERTTGNITVLSGDLDNDNDTSDNAYHVFITDELNNTSTIDGFTIIKGNSNGTGSITYSGSTFNKNNGGGITNNNSSPNFSTLIVSNNNSGLTGGGMYNESSNPVLSNTIFTNNTATFGAGVYNSISSPTINNTFFNNNTSLTQGGGLENFFLSSPVLTNVVFANNSGLVNGGALYNNNNCTPELNNVTFYSNTTNGNGGAIYNENSSNAIINNTVFYENKANSLINDIYNDSSTPTGNNNASDFTNAPGTTVTIASNPFFNTTEIAGADGILGTTDDGLRLIGNSTLVDAGNNTYNTESSDIAGRTRINDTTIDIGSYESYSYVWTGATDNDWSTATNWSSGNLPTASTDVYIPAGLTNYPTTSIALTFNNMTIDSGATFISYNTVTGTITYKRTITDTNWHLISSPVSGETVENYIGSSSLATGTGVNIGLSTYDNSIPGWSYYNESSTGTLNSGQGYGTKLSTPGTVTFSGNAQITTAVLAINNGTNRYNLVGNPFTAYLNASTFITNNGDIENRTVWLWDGTQYVTYNDAEPVEIAPGQAFFVETKESLDFFVVGFFTSNRSHQATDTFQKQETSNNFELSVSNGENASTTKVFYIEGKTTGYDNGYDSKMFGDTNYDFAVFTELISDNKGDKLAIQTVSVDNTLAIPVGIIAKAGKELTFSTKNLNLPEGTEVYLEDKVTGEFTNLAETTYKTTLTEDANGVGQFYITTSAKALSINDDTLSAISIYKSATNQITVSGLQSDAKLTVYSLLGKQIVNTSVDTSVTKINLPTLSTGVYIIKLTSENGEITKKITL